MVSIKILIDTDAAIWPALVSFPSAIFIRLSGLLPPELLSGKASIDMERTLHDQMQGSLQVPKTYLSLSSV
jgi:hypothetical protein